MELKRPRDPVQLAKLVADQLTGETSYTPVELASGEAAFDIVFAWVKRGRGQRQAPFRWTRAGYSCEYVTWMPSGPFRAIFGPDHFAAYHRPEAIMTRGVDGRLDLRGKTDLDRLILLANVVTARGANVRRL